MSLGVREVEADGSETRAPVATLGQILVGWFANSNVRNRWLKYGLVVLATASAATLLLLVLELFELGAILDAILKNPSSGSGSVPTQASAPTANVIGGGIHVLATMWSFVFFTSQLAPYELSTTGGLTIAVTGIGSFTVALIAGFLSFALGRRLESRATLAGSNAAAAFRAALIGLPMLVASLVLDLAGSAHVDLGIVSLDFRPSLLGVFVPTLVVAGSAALGALSVRPTRAGLGQPNAMRRGVSRGVFAIGAGTVAVIVLALLAVGYAQLTKSSGSGSLPIPTGTGSGPDLKGAGFGLLALLPFYGTNLIGFVWSWAFNYSQIGRSTLEIVALGPLIGALLGAAFLRRPGDRVEQAAFALTFGLGSVLIAFGTSPSNGHDTLGTPTLAVLIEALLIGAIAGLMGPYLTGLPLLRAVPRLGPIAWAASLFFRLAPEAAVPAASASAMYPAHTDEMVSQWAPHRLTLSRRHVAFAAIVLLLAGAGFGANAYLTSLYGPENAVLDYYHAQAAGNVDAMWAAADYSASSSSVTPTLSKDALQDMLRLQTNRDIKNVRSTGLREVGSGKAAVTVTFARGGSDVTQNVIVNRDSSRTHYGLYPGWRLELPPSRLSVNLFKNGGSIKVDGILISVDTTLGLVMVIPGVHRVEMGETSVTASDEQMVDTRSGSGSVSFKPTFRKGAQEAALTSLKGAFGGCAASTDIKPANCPNSGFKLGDVQSNVRWSLVSDPTVDAKFSMGDDPDTIRASGEFRMKLSYDYSYTSLYFNYHSHEDYEDSGPYGAILKADPSGGFQVVRFGRYV